MAYLQIYNLQVVREGGSEMRASEYQQGCPAFSKRGGVDGALYF